MKLSLSVQYVCVVSRYECFDVRVNFDLRVQGFLSTYELVSVAKLKSTMWKIDYISFFAYYPLHEETKFVRIQA